MLANLGTKDVTHGHRPSCLPRTLCGFGEKKRKTCEAVQKLSKSKAYTSPVAFWGSFVTCMPMLIKRKHFLSGKRLANWSASQPVWLLCQSYLDILFHTSSFFNLIERNHRQGGHVLDEFWWLSKLTTCSSMTNSKKTIAMQEKQGHFREEAH